MITLKPIDYALSEIKLVSSPKRGNEAEIITQTQVGMRLDVVKTKS